MGLTRNRNILRSQVSAHLQRLCRTGKYRCRTVEISTGSSSSGNGGAYLGIGWDSGSIDEGQGGKSEEDGNGMHIFRWVGGSEIGIESRKTRYGMVKMVVKMVVKMEDGKSERALEGVFVPAGR